MKKQASLFLFLFFFFHHASAALAETSPFGFTMPLSVSASGTSATISGTLDVSKYSEAQLKAMELVLLYEEQKNGSAVPFVDGTYATRAEYDASTNKEGGQRRLTNARSSEAVSVGGTSVPVYRYGVHPTTGAYAFTLESLTPGGVYYFAQRAQIDGVYEVRAGQFVAGKGVLTAAQQEDDIEKRSYRLLAPLPGLAVLFDPDLCLQLINEGKLPANYPACNAEDPSGFGWFINYVFRFLIGIVAVLLVFRIMLEGYKYATSDIPFIKTTAKSHLGESFAGLALALAAYLILNTINPKLIDNSISLNSLTVEVPSYPEISTGQYQQITGKAVLPKSQYVAMAQRIAQEVGIDQCLLIATVTAESNWKPNVMGSDANFALNIPSRRAFINSGQKYSGATFTKGDKSLIKDKSFLNDFVIDRSKVGLGVDWRFSAGFGLLGITFFPEEYFKTGYDTNPPPLSKKDVVPAIDRSYPLNPKTGRAYTPIEVMNPEDSLRLGALVLKNKVAACNDPYLALRAYNTGSCSKTAHNEAFRIQQYKQCKGIR